MNALTKNTATTDMVGRYDHREGNDDYIQTGNLWRLLSQGEKERTAMAIGNSLGQVPLHIQKLQLSHFKMATRNTPAWLRRSSAWISTPSTSTVPTPPN